MTAPLVLMLALSGCTTPSPGFLAAARQDVTVQGMRFAVYPRGTEAQVIRLDRLHRADRGRVPDMMMTAAAQATGCRPIPNSLTPQGGPNSAVVMVDLRC
ncbi:hypothetical protein [Paracoccus sp. Ld10]|uniref:hypothetical protein n=1 Tax=Paracoccus sp. Ld10 TaxID=649158 RepID=UPI00386C5F2D